MAHNDGYDHATHDHKHGGHPHMSAGHHEQFMRDGAAMDREGEGNVSILGELRTDGSASHSQRQPNINNKSVKAPDHGFYKGKK